jgi:addiction module HigA family antidote
MIPNKIDTSIFQPNPPLTTSAGDTLKETIEYYGITQAQFAKHLEVSQGYVSDILNRKKFMSIDFALKVQAVTGIDAEFLLRKDFMYQLQQAKAQEKDYSHLEKFDWVV